MSSNHSRTVSGCVTVAVLALAALSAGLASAGSAAAAQHGPARSARPGGMVLGHVLAPDSAISAGAVADHLNSVSCVSASDCVAVGASARSGLDPGSVLPPGPEFGLAEAWNGRAWRVMAAPDVEGSLTGVSCPAASACMAVGGGLTEAWNGRTWRVLPSPGSALAGVSCVTASWCMAVGGFPDQPVSQVWNGRRWRALGAGNGAALLSVSCVSTSDCLAVGYGEISDENSDTMNYAIGWNGRRWHVLPLPPGDNDDLQAFLTSVSCVSGALCMATGAGAADEWNGHAWSEMSFPAGGGIGGIADFSGLSCLSAASCVGVGEATLFGPDTTFGSLLAEAWNGSTWQATATPDPRDQDGFDFPARLGGVSCTAASACMAVGSYAASPLGTSPGVPSSQLTLAEQWDGQRWQIRRTPSPGDQSNGLSGISCRGVTACMAVGSYLSGSGVQLALAESWNGRSWLAWAVPSPGAHINELAAVSCPSASLCIAVGGYNTSAGGRQALAESWDGTAWQPLATRHPDFRTDLTAVACTSASACIAVGSYSTRSSGEPHPLTEKWDGHSWQLLTVPVPPYVRSGQLAGISCTSDSNCIAVGSYDDPSRNQRPLAERWNGSTWAKLTTPRIGTAQLTAVACPAPARCTAVGFRSIQGSTDPATPLAEAWDGKSWHVQPTPGPATASTGLYAVSCGTTSRCMAVGAYPATPDQNGPFPLAEEWTGSRWRLIKVPATSPDFSDLYAISCPRPARCLAAGITAIQHTLAERWNGSSWRPLVTKNP